MPTELTPPSHEHFMKAALNEAYLALEEGEIPIGAVVVLNGRIVGRGHNLTERLNDSTAHAEMQAITAAAHTLGGKYLRDCTLYVTLEPCPMCAGALFWSQVGSVIYGASDPKRGALRHEPSLLHPKTQLTGGIMESECSELIMGFFKTLRKG